MRAWRAIAGGHHRQDRAAERKATLDEVSALADVFEVSIDTLLGHARTKQTKDKEFLVSALTEAAIDLTLQVRSLSATLKQALADLEGFELQGSERGLFDSCSAGATMLDSAITVIGDTAFAFDSPKAVPSRWCSPG